MKFSLTRFPGTLNIARRSRSISSRRASDKNITPLFLSSSLYIADPLFSDIPYSIPYTHAHLHQAASLAVFLPTQKNTRIHIYISYPRTHTHTHTHTLPCVQYTYTVYKLFIFSARVRFKRILCCWVAAPFIILLLLVVLNDIYI